jgi:hypothetical protein
MKSWFFAMILSAGAGLPAAALAQSAPPPGAAGPPPAMQAEMGKVHAEAKASAYAALSADHRAKVQSIVDQVVAGGMPMRDAAAQIDTLLTPDEKKAVFAATAHARDEMHAAMAASGAPLPERGGLPPAGGQAGGPPPGGPGAGAPPPGAGQGAGDRPRRTPNAGRDLLMVSLTPAQWRALRHPAPPPAQ